MSIDYKEHLVCFIDLLGFKSTIDQSIGNNEIRKALYAVIHDLKENSLKKRVYGNIPYFSLDQQNTVKPAGEVFGEDIVEQFSESLPLKITQFSDSFVISCPSNNSASCTLLLECIYTIKLMFFYDLGMMLRGGIALGQLIHEEGGVLFGPAMNEAYSLESKLAIYPRVVISDNAYNLLNKSREGHPALKAIFSAFDGHKVFDLVSIFDCPLWTVEGAGQQLKAIEQDILQNSQDAHPKIAYLLDRWEQKQKEVDSQVLQ